MTNAATATRVRNELRKLRTQLEIVLREVDTAMSKRTLPFTGASEVLELVARAHGMSPAQLVTQTNGHKIAGPRQIAQYLMRHVLAMSYPQIGQLTGEMHHTTVLHSYRKIANMRQANQEFDRKIWALEDAIRGEGESDGLNGERNAIRMGKVTGEGQCRK